MSNFVRAYCNRAAIRSAAPGTPIPFIASTDRVARDGMIIEASAWRLLNYQANPVVLWVHAYDKPPIGRAAVRVEDGALKASITFDQGDEFARQIEKKYLSGFMNAVSVGWETLKLVPGNPPRVTEAELLDVSCVPVPADPGALVERQARAMRELGIDLLSSSMSSTLSRDSHRGVDREIAELQRLLAQLHGA